MTKSQSIEERRWVVEGVQLAGVCSGPVDAPVILAMHGWLDNAESFTTLRRYLPAFRLIALDMPGHGLSGHRSSDSGYQIWDDLPQLAALFDLLGQEKFILLGHSRGAMISTLLAATLPARVSHLITLDGLVPMPADDAALITQMRTFLKDRQRQAAKDLRIFESAEDFVERRSRSGEPKNIAAQLARRALKETPQGFEWRGDPRLSGASALKFNRGQIEATLNALEMPVMNIWATPSERMKAFSDSARKFAVECIPNLTTVEIAGHHHWHMEEDPAREIADRVKEFTARS